MKKIVPPDAHLLPKEAQKVFAGVIFDTYQWQQKMFDGTYETFEMLKRPDIGVAIAVKDGKLVILRQKQPRWKDFRYALPGGRSEKGETGLQTAQREMLEETGMTFRNWKLLDVIQGPEKIESFLYLYLATDFIEQTEVRHDSGEIIEIELADFEAVHKLADEEPRLEGPTLKRFNSIEELLNAPEFQGVEIETS